MKHNPIPEKYRILSDSALKVFALVTMLIDHVAVVFSYRLSNTLFSYGKYVLTPYKLMRFIGRWSFPVYAFLIVEGFLHTGNRRRYGLRLLLFAFLSEIPWNLEHTGTFHYAKQNVFFTLFLGYAGLCLIEKLEKKEEMQKNGCLLLILLILSLALNADYGCSGFALILILYLLRESLLYKMVISMCLLSSHLKICVSFLVIGMYNGKRGFIRSRFLQILFYAIYPLHMFVFYLLVYR